MIRLFICFIVLSSCTKNSGGQKAFHLDNKGISCDADWVNNEQFIICGETSNYANHENGSTQKDAFVLVTNQKAKDVKGFIVGDQLNNFRFENVNAIQNQFLFSGYGFENKNAIVAGFSNNMEMKWAFSSDQLQGFEEPKSAVNKDGNFLIISKKPDTTPYYGVFSLFTKEGKELWTKKLDHIDVMSDIFSANNGDFILNYKEKGAYIDGGTRKKYFISPVLRVSTEGKITYQMKFLIDREKFMDLDFHQVLETKSGDLYFVGSGWTVSNRTDLLIIKTDANIKIKWSSSYKTDHELAIKAAILNEKEELIIAADSYGHSGGMLRAAISPSGDVLWNSFNTSTPYEQIKTINYTKTGYDLIYDKTLSFAAMTTNLEGVSCLGKTSSLTLVRSNAEVILSTHNAEFEETLARWKPCELKVKAVSGLKLIEDCGKF